MITQAKDLRKASGGVRKAHHNKRWHHRGSRPTLTKLGEKTIISERTKGSNSKLRVLRGNTLNVYDPTEKKFKKGTIKTVVENQANRHYSRANIMTKGAIVMTDLGKARITSRPGQEGIINATLISEK